MTHQNPPTMAEALAALNALKKLPTAHDLNTTIGKEYPMAFEILRAALSPAPVEGLDDATIKSIVEEEMQSQWNDWCADTGCHPDDIQRRGRETFFEAGKWASNVGRSLATRLSSLYAQSQRCAVDVEKLKREAVTWCLANANHMDLEEVGNGIIDHLAAQGYLTTPSSADREG